VGLLFRRRRSLMILAAAGPVDTTAELERLAQLHQAGELSDDEFTAAKARLLRV
jgi:Short C-terminal domain